MIRPGVLLVIVMSAMPLPVMPALAEGPPPPQRQWPSRGVDFPMVQVPCTCRAQGRNFLVGESICLGARRAVCDMELNVTSWRQTGEACTTSAWQPRHTGIIR